MFTESVTVSVAVSKVGVVLIKHRSESQWIALLGYFAILTNVSCYYHVVYNNFVFQQDGAPVYLAFNTVQLLQCKTQLPFSSAMATLQPRTMRLRESYSSMNMRCK